MSTTLRWVGIHRAAVPVIAIDKWLLFVTGRLGLWAGQRHVNTNLAVGSPTRSSIQHQRMDGRRVVWNTRSRRTGSCKVEYRYYGLRALLPALVRAVHDAKR